MIRKPRKSLLFYCPNCAKCSNDLQPQFFTTKKTKYTKRTNSQMYIRDLRQIRCERKINQ